MSVSAISSVEKAEIKSKTAVPLIAVAIVSILMLFTGLLSAYLVSRGDAKGVWQTFELPTSLITSTAIIVISSVTMFFAFNAAKKDDYNSLSLHIGLTFLLGCSFTYSQFICYGDLIDMGIYAAGSSSNAAGSYLYLLTALHLLHLAGGMLSLLFVFVRSLFKKYNSSNLSGLEASAVYWHFLTVLWILLYVFLFVNR